MKDIVSSFLDTAESYASESGLFLETGIVKDHLESHAAKDVAIWVRT